MTPMRQAFVIALMLVEHEDSIERLLINKWLIATMDCARDDAEAGAAAQFVAAAILYLDARHIGDSAEIAAALLDLEVFTQNLAAVMLLRRGRVKVAPRRGNIANGQRTSGGISLH
ncbi:MAG: hypothetical protein JWM36_3226 [Hyphomicrobiales bacterium]|nr:hypothetical protein [Hyphomicrobiales bacterium]